MPNSITSESMKLDVSGGYSQGIGAIKDMAGDPPMGRRSVANPGPGFSYNAEDFQSGYTRFKGS
jgi:hypothetical protein